MSLISILYHDHTFSWSTAWGVEKLIYFVHSYLISCMIGSKKKKFLAWLMIIIGTICHESLRMQAAHVRKWESLSLSFLAWSTVILSLTSMWNRTLFDKLQEMPSCVCVCLYCMIDDRSQITSMWSYLLDRQIVFTIQFLFS